MADPDDKEPKYWFRAKRYGWGWGLPSTWQGWATLILYLGAVSLSGYLFPPARETTAFMALSILSSVLLIAIARAKGESPRWRWGKR